MPLQSNKPVLDPDGRYSVTAAAEALGIHRCTIWRWVKQGKLKPYVSKTNSRTRFRGKDLINLWNSEF